MITEPLTDDQLVYRCECVCVCVCSWFEVNQWSVLVLHMAGSVSFVFRPVVCKRQRNFRTCFMYMRVVQELYVQYRICRNHFVFTPKRPGFNSQRCSKDCLPWRLPVVVRLLINDLIWGKSRPQFVGLCENRLCQERCFQQCQQKMLNQLPEDLP